MKKVSRCGLIITSLLCLFIYTRNVEAACRNPNLVIRDAPFIVPADASGFVEIRWFGHSFFQITSSGGTKIITDPFGAMGYPMPEVWPHVVTVGREHGNHNNVDLAQGSPIVLRGLKEGTFEWNDVRLTVRDVLIYNVPIHQRGYMDFEASLKGAAFVFEVDGMCILHAGDISQPFNEDQLQLVGHIDVLLVPIGGRYTAGPQEAQEIIQQLRPKIVVPMHYFNNSFILQQFLDGPYWARVLETNTFSVSSDNLPPNTEVIVPQVIWYGRDDDM